MDAAEFYNEFKNALNYLDVGFHGMSEAKINCGEGWMSLEANNKKAVIFLETKKRWSRIS